MQCLLAAPLAWENPIPRGCEQPLRDLGKIMGGLFMAWPMAQTREFCGSRRGRGEKRGDVKRRSMETEPDVRVIGRGEGDVG